MISFTVQLLEIGAVLGPASVSESESAAGAVFICNAACTEPPTSAS